jgi:hypothetical protein
MKNELPPAVASRLEKAAVDNGFDQELPRHGDWLGFATTQCPLRVWLGAFGNSIRLAVFSQPNVAGPLAEYGTLMAAPLRYANRKEVGIERDQHAQVFVRLGEHFDPLVRRLLARAPHANGRMQHDGNGLQLVVDYGNEPSTAALDLVKVLAFDLATVCRSIDGATKLLALHVHDSPQSSDLGLSIYHELFHVMRELQDVGSSPQFKYIVTTASRPPDDLAGDEAMRLQLNGSRAEAWLLRRDL